VKSKHTGMIFVAVTVWGFIVFFFIFMVFGVFVFFVFFSITEIILGILLSGTERIHRILCGTETTGLGSLTCKRGHRGCGR